LVEDAALRKKGGGYGGPRLLKKKRKEGNITRFLKCQ